LKPDECSAARPDEGFAATTVADTSDIASTTTQETRVGIATLRSGIGRILTVPEGQSQRGLATTARDHGQADATARRCGCWCSLDEVEALVPERSCPDRTCDWRVRANLWREPTSPAPGQMRQEVETAARRDLVRWSSYKGRPRAFEHRRILAKHYEWVSLTAPGTGNCHHGCDEQMFGGK
jgi:hypothetical protein